MDISREIRKHAAEPLPHQLLLSLLKDYRRPNDKIHHLLKTGVLSPLVKGLYLAGPALQAGSASPFLIANHILGPSYVSSDSMLAYYGLIPERVYEVISMTTKASRRFDTDAGTFSYRKLRTPYYAFGIGPISLPNERYALVASPEKALFDKIVTTPGLVLRSNKEARAILLENLRMDPVLLRGLDREAMGSWLPESPKRESLSFVMRTLGEL